ncbi:MAG TPA: arginase family protein [Candidatus Obscuribacterales bacterium]
MLNLFFPQWQGSGRLDLALGVQAVYQLLQPKMEFIPIEVASTYALTLEENIWGLRQIIAQLDAVCRTIQVHDPDRIFTLGGDCGVELAPVSFLNQKYGQNLTVLWFDAHGDLNTPLSSPSGHFHGMPLRTLLGEGHPELMAKTFSRLHPEQILLLGTREFDPPEVEFVQRHQLKTFTAKSICDRKFDDLLTTLHQRGTAHLYVHLDLDVLDPEEYPHVACPTAGGISLDSLHELLVYLHQNFNVVGFSILEFLPTENPHQAIAEMADWVQQLYGLWVGSLSMEKS